MPAAWEAQPDQMVKRRCLMVYDGSNMLCKDEMVMTCEWDGKPPPGDPMLSNLDFWTTRRAEAFLDAMPARGEAMPLMGEAR